MRVVLELQTGSQAGESVGIEAGQTASIGRSSRADFTVAGDANMSGVHFGISVLNSQCLFKDLDSKNGVRINGQKTKQSTLADGDQILAGTSVFSVSVLATIESPQRDFHREPALVPSVSDSIPRPASPYGQSANDIPAEVSEPNVAGSSDSPPAESESSSIELVTLSYQYPGGSIRNIWLRPGESISVGRTANADHWIPEGKRLSSIHFEVAVERNRCLLRDLQSTNGTTVNDQAAAEIDLFHGDQIRAGGIDFSVAMKGGPAPRLVVNPEEAPTRGIKKVEIPTDHEMPPVVGTWFPCGSGLRLFRNRDPQESMDSVISRLNMVSTPVAVFQIEEAASDERPTFSVSPEKDFAIDFGLKVEDFSQQISERIGENTTSVFFLTDSEFNICEHLSGAADVGCPYGNPCFETPEILSHFLANGNPQQVDSFFAPFAAILTEVNQGERWGLFVRSEFVNLSIKLGFTM